MKASIKFVTSLVLTAGVLVASSSIAHAGQGGSAGSVGVKFTSATDVSSLSTSVAVGKNAAAASARTDRNTYSSAVGGGGTVELNNAGTFELVNYAVGEETTAKLGTEQKNVLGANVAKLNPVSGVLLP